MKAPADIPDDEREEVIRHTRPDQVGCNGDGDPDFNRNERIARLAEQLGTFDSVVSLKELLRLRESA